MRLLTQFSFESFAIFAQPSVTLNCTYIRTRRSDLSRSNCKDQVIRNWIPYISRPAVLDRRLHGLNHGPVDLSALLHAPVNVVSSPSHKLISQQQLFVPRRTETSAHANKPATSKEVHKLWRPLTGYCQCCPDILCIMSHCI